MILYIFSYRIFGFFDFRTPVHYVRDLDMIKRITVKDFDHFEDRTSFIDENLDELFGNSLFLMRGQKWRHMRATLSPAFTGAKMRQMFELVSDCAHDLKVHLLDEASTGRPINWEVKELFARYANDVIATTAFGIKVDSIANADNDFYQIGRRSLDFSGLKAVSKFLFIRIVPTIMRKLNIQITDARVIQFFGSMVSTTMHARRDNNIFRPDMIDILMKHWHTQPNSSERQRQWTEKELIAQCFLFFLAGFETVSTQLTFLIHELMLNEDIQNRLYEEVAATERTLDGQRVDFKTLQGMKYMDQVVSEGLRKWPSTPTLDRKCVKNYWYDNEAGYRVFIGKGSHVVIPIYAMHHNPQYFPNPDVFDPERFSSINRQRILPNTYIPFGTGPRQCIGMQ